MEFVCALFAHDRKLFAVARRVRNFRCVIVLTIQEIALGWSIYLFSILKHQFYKADNELNLEKLTSFHASSLTLSRPGGGGGGGNFEDS